MRQVRRWAGPAVALLVVTAVLWRLGTGPFINGIKAVDARVLLAATAIVFVTTVTSAWRWTIIARALGLRLSLPAAVAAYYRTLFLNLTLPSGIAGDVHRGISHGRAEHDLSRAVRAVVWERASGQVVQGVLTIAVLLALPSPVRSSVPFIALAAVAAGVVVAFAVRMRPGGAGSRWTRIRDSMVTDIREGVLRRNALPAVVLTSAIVVVGHTITFLIAARTAGVTMPISGLLPLAVLALAAMVLPSVAGWGPREAVTAWVFSAAGLGAGRGAAAAVTYGVLVLAASLPGAIVLLIGWVPQRRLSTARPPRHVPCQSSQATGATPPDPARLRPGATLEM